MKSVKNFLEKKAIAFESLDKKELHNVCGSGKFVWDTKTKTMYYVVGA